MSRLLDEPHSRGDIDKVTDDLIECATGEEFIGVLEPRQPIGSLPGGRS